VKLGDLSWPEVEQRVKSNPVVILPIGSFEAHGPGLPLDVDAHTVGEIAVAAGALTGALVAPTVSYGYSSTWTHYPGTVTLRPETLSHVLSDILESLIRTGFRKLFLLNGHRHNYSVMETVARATMDRFHAQTPDLVLATGSYWEIARDEINRLRRSDRGGMAHACELETALQLHLRPDRVNVEAARAASRLPAGWDLGDHQPAVLFWRGWLDPQQHSGVIGQPGLATADAGQAFFTAIVARVAHYVTRMQRGEFVDYYSQPKPDAARG
jgi:creatinine amidohydrolase